MSERVRVAAFDVDGTLTERDCVVPFLRRTAGTARLSAGLLRRTHRVLPAAARRDRDRLKALACAAAFDDLDARTVEADAADFARLVAANWMRRDARELIEAHRSRGDAVVLVSASFELYLRPLADLLGGAGVLATRLAVSGGRLTGQLDGANCRGPEKVKRLHAWLAERWGSREAVHLTAYGDSAGDRELLVDADDRGGADRAHHRNGSRREAPPAATVGAVISGLIRTARPRQWLKNVLVFAAPGAAGVLDQATDLGLTLITFVAFCMASSSVYFLNDLIDVDSDRNHPRKRLRPIAAGDVSIAVGWAASIVLALASLGMAALTGRWQTAGVVGLYLAVNVAYNLGLKHVPVIDLVTIASGFVLRAGAGAVAVDVPMSRWFVLCTTFGSLFIVVGKRYAELNAVGVGAGTRPALDSYTVGFLRMVLAISCGSALLSYCVWAFETSAVAESTLPFYELSIVPMLTALLRYLLVLEHGGGAAPEEVFASDRVLQLLGLCWIVIYGVAVYAN